MKKALLLLLVTTTIFFPPLSIYLAISAARNLQFNEAQDTLQSSMQSELDSLDHSFNEAEVLMREFSRFRQTINAKNETQDNHASGNKLTPSGKDKRIWEIDLMKHELPRLIARFPFPLEVNCVIQNLKIEKKIRIMQFGKELGLRLITSQIESMRPTIGLSLQPGRSEELTANLWQEADEESLIRLNRMKRIQVFLANSMNDIQTNKSSQMVLKVPESIMMLTGERVHENLTIFVLADLTDLRMHKNFGHKIVEYKHDKFGVGLKFSGTQKPVFSSYFLNRPDLKSLISKQLNLVGARPVSMTESGHEIMISGYDRRKQCRYFVVSPAVKINSGETARQNMILAILCILSCISFKVLIEKLVMGRGPDLSIKVLLPVMFLFLIIQPVFAAACLVGDFFHSSFANVKTNASDKLTNEIQDIDLATLDRFRETLNLARSFSSIERMAKFAQTPYCKNELELSLNLVRKILEQEKTLKFTSLWLKADGQPFSAVRWHSGNKWYEQAQIDNPVTQLFGRRFQEIISYTSGETKKAQIESPQKLDQELKSEFSRDFFLKILGPDTFFRFRQNHEMIVNFNATFKREMVLSGPVSFRNRPYAFAAWHIGLDSSVANFPNHRLKDNPLSPRLAFSGTELSFASLEFSLSKLKQNFPELCQIAQTAHLTRSRVDSRVEQEDQTIISAAIPANHSYHTIAGSEILKSYSRFRRELIVETLKYLLLLISAGVFLAFAGAIYFTSPLEELTDATKQIAQGNFGYRITEAHPDEFAEIGRSFNLMARMLDEGQRLKSFVSDSVLREVETNDDSELTDRAQSRHATIIFSAICDFSSYHSSHTANEVFSLLQKHLQAADNATAEFGGEIDKMIEDKIMIVFEHECDDKQVASMAINAAASISRQFHDATGFNLGIGINTGLTVAGVMGAANARLSRTVVGDPVNLAARLASLASHRPEGGIVISGQMKQSLPTGFAAEKLPISHVKGKTQSVEAYILKKEV